MSAGAQRHGLTFEWPLRGKISLVMPGYIAASVAMHALAFYVFQVVYPPTVSIAPPPAVVSLLTPSTPENQAMLAWVAFEDPAAVANPQEALPKGLLDSPYQPLWVRAHSAPRTAERAPEPVHPPATQNVLSIVGSAMRAAKKPDTIAPGRGTEVRFSGLLANRKIETQPDIHLEAATTASLEPARFLIGVSSSGEVRFAFVQQSSGDKSIDQQAEAHLAGMRFAPAEAGLTWGGAIFFWGTDAFAGAKAPAQNSKPE
jgi:hypothetical protein